jgi:hypothetical protein
MPVSRCACGRLKTLGDVYRNRIRKDAVIEHPTTETAECGSVLMPSGETLEVEVKQHGRRVSHKERAGFYASLDDQ